MRSVDAVQGFNVDHFKSNEKIEIPSVEVWKTEKFVSAALRRFQLSELISASPGCR